MTLNYRIRRDNKFNHFLNLAHRKYNNKVIFNPHNISRKRDYKSVLTLHTYIFLIIHSRYGLKSLMIASISIF